jgi:glutamate synthase (NADPH/NADH) small chain
VVPEPPSKRTGRKVAVVGSGPAGISAAAQLNRAGHTVTVFERADRPGGLLMYGIPNMKLDKESVVLRRIRQMEAEGVIFKCNCEIGKDITSRQLMEEHDAVVLCTGATKPRDLPIEGRQLKGIHFAMDFLTANTRSLLDGKQNGSFISAEGKDVVIIGGGDTGTDCVGTSVRHGCKSLVQVEILPKPPLERAQDNPWPEWPKVYKMDYGQEEAAAKFGDDPRVYLTTAKKFEGDEHGNVKAIHLVQIKWEKNEKGQFIPKDVPGTERVVPAQLVLLAMGFLGPEQPLLESLGIERDARSNARAEHGKYTTSIPKVFAAGDCRRGQSLVVWAFNEGRGAAREVDRFLMGATDLP